MIKVAITGSPDKPRAPETLAEIQRWLTGRAEVVFSELTYDTSRILPMEPNLLIVLGGDGTLISAVHGLGEDQLPILGVNLGKLGYMAEFTLEQLEREGDFLFASGLPCTRRLLLDVEHRRRGELLQRSPAVNDCVLLAGTPFRMIGLQVSSDGDRVANLRADGLIIATPSGSTAHNLSAGGPVLEPTAQALLLTPLCPHALTFRPVVLDAARVIEVDVLEVNEGTTASIDGQRNWHVEAGDRLIVRRFAADFQVVRNPESSVWSAMRQRLMWGAGPRAPQSSE